MALVGDLASVDAAVEWCKLPGLQNLGVDPTVVIETFISSVLTQVTEGKIVLDSPAFRSKMHETFILLGTKGDESWFAHLASCFSLLACRNLSPRARLGLAVAEVSEMPDSGRENPDVRDPGEVDTTLDSPIAHFVQNKSAVFLRALDAHEQKEPIIEVASRANIQLVLEFAIRSKTDSAVCYFDSSDSTPPDNATSLKDFDFKTFSLNIIAIASTHLLNEKVIATRLKAANTCVSIMQKIVKGWTQPYAIGSQPLLCFQCSVLARA
jgi:hypothetical protein